MARKRNATSKKPVLFIACEGTRTEYDYFLSWAQREDVLEFFENVEVYPDAEEEENPQTNPYKLVEIAGERLISGSCNYAWVVCDRDGHAKMQEMFQEAENRGVGVAFSARSFEEWILMHFEKNDFAFAVTECKAGKKPINCGTQLVPDCKDTPCICGHIRRRGYIPDYHKSTDVYGETIGNLEMAKVNAAWIRWRIESSITEKTIPLHFLNPYTNVDRLILFLQQKNEIIHWGAHRQQVQISNWILCVEKNEKEIAVELSHQFAIRKLVNEIFCSSNFFVTDDSLHMVPLQIRNRVLSSSNNDSTINLLEAGDTLKIIFEFSALPFFVFYLPDESLKLFIQFSTQ
jgi:hypothetical protein